MRKRCWLLLILMLLLTGCGGEDDAIPPVLESYQNMENCTMEAEVVCQYEDEVKCYVLRCEYTPARSTVTVLEPEELEGVGAVFEGESASLFYEDLCLDAGTLGGENLSPAAVLPCMVDAIRSGYLLEQSRETLGEESCRRLTFETNGEMEKLRYTLWFREQDSLPVMAEVFSGERRIFEITFRSFAFDTAPVEPDADESGT